MLRTKDILDEKNKCLHKPSEDVTFPMEEKDLKMIDDMIEHLTLSQIPEEAEKYDFRPGMGLAAIQVGIPKRYFVVVYEVDEGEFENYILVNPKIVSASNEMIYVDEGEGCLSVKNIQGFVTRPQTVTVKAQDRFGNYYTLTGSDYLAQCICHELDHLDGILFTDIMDEIYSPRSKKNKKENKVKTLSE